MHCLRPLLIIDATHLKGQYKGTNLVAVGMDGNKQIVPIAFGICKGETSPCWSWWMSVLKECIGDSPNLLFISDRNAAIALKQNERSYMENMQAYTPEEFSNEMSNLQAIQPDAYHKLIKVDPQRWSRAHCPLVRYNYMTSNSVESVNACTVLYRKLQVLKLADTYRAMVQECFPGYLVATIAVTRYLGMTDCVQFVADWFKKEKYQGTYAESIHFLGNIQEWEFPHHIQKAIPPKMDNPQPGRPKNTNRIKSQGEEPRSIHCSRCRQAGHRRDQCNKPIVAKPPVNTHTRNDQEFPRNEQPSFYNPHQQYDNTFQVQTMTFKVLLHHYGRFISPPGRKIIDGLVATVDPVELDSFSTNQVKLILTNSLGYDSDSPTFLYLRNPNCSLDSGLIPLANAIQDRDMLITYTQTHQNQLHVYVYRVEISPLVVADQRKDERN
ncbi:transposase, MuDR, MULE transposase domain protein [Tanacetum coccineum]